jgi:hypothetical protein
VCADTIHDDLTPRRMPTVKYPLIVNLALYQCIWFMAVLAQEKSEPFLILLLLIHLYLVADRGVELRLMLWCAAIGVTTDSLLSLAGVYSFSQLPAFFPIPLWLVAIWFGFAATLRHSLKIVMKKPLLAIPAGALLAPLSYLTAGKLGAVSFPLDYLWTCVILGLVWSVLMFLMLTVCRLVDVDGGYLNRYSHQSVP